MKDINRLSEKQYKALQKDIATFSAIMMKTAVTVANKYSVDANEVFSLFLYTGEKYVAQTDLNEKTAFSFEEGMTMLRKIVKLGRELHIE